MTIHDTPTDVLTIHPALRHMPRWELDDPRFSALVEDIRDRQIDQPILIDRENRVVDGRHRFWAAKQLQFLTVSTCIVPDDQVYSIIVSSLLDRRHYTKGQRAYISYPILEDAHLEICKRRLYVLKRGTGPGSAAATTIEKWISEIGFSRELFFQAAKVHALFQQDPSYRAEMEPKILSEHDPVGLGAVIAGHAGKISTRNGKPDFTPTRQLDLFTKTLTDELTRWGYWTTADDDARRTHYSAVRKAAASLDPQTCDEIAEYHARLSKEFRAAAHARV